MAHVFGSSWMVLLLVSVTVMLLQSQAVQGIGCWSWLRICFRRRDEPGQEEPGQEEPGHDTVSGVPNLKEEVLANCRRIVSGTDSERCNRFWDNFKKAFVNKDPHTITPAAYNDLIKSEPIREDGKEILLYSKTGDKIWQLKNKEHFLNIWQTIYGSLGVDFDWCGKKGSQEVYTSGCPGNARGSYWKSVSAAFAKAATRVATVLLNGAVPEPYDKKTIFATDEVPNLSDKVTLRVILVRKGSSSKTCDDEPLKRLEREVKGKYECITKTESNFRDVEPQNRLPSAKPSHNANG